MDNLNAQVEGHAAIQARKAASSCQFVGDARTLWEEAFARCFSEFCASDRAKAQAVADRRAASRSPEPEPAPAVAVDPEPEPEPETEPAGHPLIDDPNLSE